MSVELEAVERDPVSLTTTAIIPAPVVGGVPPETIRAWDAETLTSANEYTDAAMAALPGSDVTKAYVDAADGALGERIDALPTPDVDKAYVDAADGALGERIDNLPTADVDKAYVDAQDQSIRDQIDAIPDPNWGDLADKPGTFPPSAHSHPISEVTGLTTALSGKSDTGHTHTKAQVGLGNVDNTSDASKPVSTVQQAALDGKASTAHQHAASDVTSGVFSPARLGTGTANASSFLSGDGSFKVPPGASNAQVEAAVNAYLAANPPGGDPWSRTGYGMPNGTVTAPVGTRYTDLEGTNGAWLWIKKTGTNNVGWHVLEGDTGRRKLTLGAGLTGNVYIQRDAKFVTLSMETVANTVTGEVQLLDAGLPSPWQSTVRRFGPIYRAGVVMGAVDANSNNIWRFTINTQSSFLTAELNFRARPGGNATDSWPVGALPGTPA